MIPIRTRQSVVYNSLLFFKITIVICIIIHSISFKTYAQEVLKISGSAVQNEIMCRFVLVHSVLNENDYFYPEITKDAGESNPLSSLCNKFITDNHLHLDYLVNEETIQYLNSKDESITDPSAIVKNFSQHLNNREDFVAEVRLFFGLFLKSKGYEIVDFIEKTRETFSFKELKAIAVRNIYPTKTPQGKLIFKVCVACEGYKDLPKRNTHLEAFSFQVVFNANKSETFKMLLENCQSIANHLHLSSEDDVHVERFQGCFWSLLFQDERFADFLKKSYSKKKSYLPFKIAMLQESQ